MVTPSASESARRARCSAVRGRRTGAEVEREPQDQFYGERSGTIRDPFGHRWNIGHSIEEVSPEEMQRRYTEMMEQG